MKFPTRFPKWNKAIDGLDDPLRWAVECELSCLSVDPVFPRLCQLWELRQDCDLPYLAWRSRCTFNGRVRLAGGERFRVVSVDDSQKVLLLQLVPVRYEELHSNIVPQQVRNAAGYLKYSIPINTAFLNEHFRLVETPA